MSQAPASITVFIPLTIRKRNGRPKIVPPADVMPANDGGVDPHILKAIAKAWSWRRRLKSGQSATIEDLARTEDVAPSFIRRTLKLAFLAPAVLEQILIALVAHTFVQHRQILNEVRRRQAREKRIIQSQSKKQPGAQTSALEPDTSPEKLL